MLSTDTWSGTAVFATGEPPVTTVVTLSPWLGSAAIEAATMPPWLCPASVTGPARSTSTGMPDCPDSVAAAIERALSTLSEQTGIPVEELRAGPVMVGRLAARPGGVVPEWGGQS